MEGDSTESYLKKWINWEWSLRVVTQLREKEVCGWYGWCTPLYSEVRGWLGWHTPLFLSGYLWSVHSVEMLKWRFGSSRSGTYKCYILCFVLLTFNELRFKIPFWFLFSLNNDAKLVPKILILNRTCLILVLEHYACNLKLGIVASKTAHEK